MSEVTIRFIEGHELNLPINDELTVGELKKTINENFHITGELSLIFKGEILPEDRKILSLDGVDKTYLIGHVKKPKRQFSSLYDETISSLRERRYSYLNPLLELRRQQAMQLREQQQAKDPANFNELVQGLTEMGFDEQLSKNALRLSSYSQQIAITMLLNGTVPRTITTRPHFLDFDIHTPRMFQLQSQPTIEANTQTQAQQQHQGNPGESTDSQETKQLESDTLMHSINSQVYQEQPLNRIDDPPIFHDNLIMESNHDLMPRMHVDSSIDNHLDSEEEEDIDNEEDEDEEDLSDEDPYAHDYRMGYFDSHSGTTSDTDMETSYSDLSDSDADMYLRRVDLGDELDDSKTDEKTDDLNQKIQQMYDKTQNTNDSSSHEREDLEPQSPLSLDISVDRNTNQSNDLPQFTEHQRDDIRTLMELTGFDFNTVAPIYEMCDKNLELASQYFLNS